jgi:putative membrane protein
MYRFILAGISKYPMALTQALETHRRPDIWKGMVAGTLGGLVGSWAMLRFQSIWSNMSQGRESPNLAANVPEHREKRTQEFAPSRAARRSEQPLQKEDATIKIGSMIAEGVLQRAPNPTEKAVAGSAVHYAFGAAAGAIYGASCELFPVTKGAAGLPFGAAVFLAADGIAMPALGLSEGFVRGPFVKHAYGLTTHFVFGVTTEMVRRFVRVTLRNRQEQRF